MIPTLLIIALLMLGSAAVAMLLRNLVHSALLLVLSWAGLAGFYLWAGAEFAAFAQVIVYIGAVSMVVLFAVLLTRQSREPSLIVEPASRLRGLAAVISAASVASLIGTAVLTTNLRPEALHAPVMSVRQIGQELMGRHAAALLIVGVLLTVALLGAIVIASTDSKSNREGTP